MQILRMIKIIFSFIFIIIVTSIVYFLYTSHKDINKDVPTYVGMNKCSSCHKIEHQSLSHTLHPKIFKKVTNQSEILGDFTHPNPLVNFKKEDITYVVGSKWEQVYMHKINGEYYPFTAKWMVLTEKWKAYKVHTWKQTPASKKCNSCHTTGYSQDDFSFNEFGVKCEACHGPASKHVEHQKMNKNKECIICHTEHKEFKNDIVVTQKSALCGQCHTKRSTTEQKAIDKKSSFNFPLEYLPSQDINASFVKIKPTVGKNTKNLWGNGLSKNSHQEFADFSFSKHSKSLINLKTKKNPHGGKKNDNCLKCHSQDYRSAKENEKPTIDTAKLGITCVTCHEPHGIGKNIRNKKSLNVICGECHINSFKGSKKHYPCPQMSVRCVDCHMPLIVKTGGTYSIRSHAFKIVPPIASKKYSMPSSCQNGSCHQNKSIEWAMDEYNKFYKKNEVETLANTLKTKQ